MQIEIPLADKLEDAEAVVRAAEGDRPRRMGGHTRRFNPSHQWVRKKILAGELKIQQMDVQTYFFRRTNMNALGQAAQLDRSPAVAPRRHTVDLFQYQTGERHRGGRACRDRCIRSSRSPWT